MPFVLADPALIIQTALTATALFLQYRAMQEAAEAARIQAQAQATTAKISAEFQAYELEQGIINKQLKRTLVGLNIQTDQFMIPYVQQFSEFNAQMSLTEGEAVGIMADLKADILKRGKDKVLRDVGLTIGDLNRAGDTAKGEIVANLGASGLSLDSDTAQTLVTNMAMETNRNASRALLEAGDSLSLANVEIREKEVQAARGRTLGKVKAAEFRKGGAEAEFGFEQKIISGRTKESALTSGIANLRTSADMVRLSGVAAANSAIAAGAAQASAAKWSGFAGMAGTLNSGFSNIYSTYMAKR